ncbi:MAG: ThuA domain-containing protein [Parasporobacterium sp.]|nr:ThuA domain-containing protein [Parasporobacterium sp.]
MKVLFLCGDKWHPSEVLIRGLSDLAPDEISFDFVEDAKDILTPDMLKNYPVIINAKYDQLTAANNAGWFDAGVTEVMPSDLRAYIEAGGGFISLHSGNSFFKDDNPDYIDLVGNYFVQHPPRCPVTVTPTGSHPITEGILPFTERDEHYQIVVVAKDADVFLESTSETGGKQVAGYTRLIGDGRLCVLTPGHIAAVLRNGSFRAILKNAIAWAAKA